MYEGVCWVFVLEGGNTALDVSTEIGDCSWPSKGALLEEGTYTVL